MKANSSLAQGRIAAMGMEHITQVLAMERTRFPDPWTRGMWEEELKAPGALACVYLLGRELAGFIALREAPGGCESELMRIAVSEGRDGMGIGGALFRTAKVALEARCGGPITVYLEVRESGLRAIRAYEAWGFRKNGVRAGYYTRPDEGAVLMSYETAD